MTDLKAKYSSQVNESQLEINKVQKEKRKSNNLKKKYIVVAVVLCLLVLILTLTVVLTLKKDKSKASQGLLDNRPFTLLISLDGFRTNYLERGITPNLDKLAQNGVKADSMIPSFPTKTFTNHYTIATGLYPESHGIVSNNFYDPDLKANFKIGGPQVQESKWWKGEPIWVTAIKNGLKSASFFWVGSEAEIQGIRPTYWKKFDNKIPWLERIGQVIKWMKLPSKERPQMITLYFEEPDKTGHKFGPNNKKEMNQMIKLVDSTIGKLITDLEDNDLTDKVNIIVVSDHGMTPVDCYANITLSDKINMTDVYYQGLGASSLLYLKNQSFYPTIYDNLKCPSPNLNVYTTHNLLTPRRYHYNNNKRIGDFALSPNPPWSVIVRNGRCYPDKGGHGYDNLLEDLRSIFIASGPAFKRNYKFEQLLNIEIYNLITDLLHIPAAPNNGTYGSLNHLLNDTFLQTLPLKADKDLFDFTPRYFPENFDEALADCKYCTCSYCDRDIYPNLTYYRKNLNLSVEEVTVSHQNHAPWGLPKSIRKTSDLVLTQRHYVTGYSPTLHIPLWVTYKLTAKQLMTNIPRSNCFRKDIRLHNVESSYCSSYSRSGFDRGHMAPSGDFNFDIESEQDGYVLSNIVPQYPKFNRHDSWIFLEKLTRNRTMIYGDLYVYSGSIFDMDNDGIKDSDGHSKHWLKNKTGSVAIPTHFFKIMMRCDDVSSSSSVENCTSLRTISYIVPHTKELQCDKKVRPMETYVMNHVATIRDVELLTGLNFFPKMPPSKQAEIKTKIYRHF